MKPIRQLLVLFLAGTNPALSDETPAVAGSSTTDDIRHPNTDARSGYVAYIDMNTGQLLYGPPPETAAAVPLSLETRMQISTSGAGLYQQQNIQGGYTVDLQGRFRHATMVTISGFAEEPRYFCVGNQPVIDIESGEPVNRVE